MNDVRGRVTITQGWAVCYNATDITSCMCNTVMTFGWKHEWMCWPKGEPLSERDGGFACIVNTVSGPELHQYFTRLLQLCRAAVHCCCGQHSCLHSWSSWSDAPALHLMQLSELWGAKSWSAVPECVQSCAQACLLIEWHWPWLGIITFMCINIYPPCV